MKVDLDYNRAPVDPVQPILTGTSVLDHPTVVIQRAVVNVLAAAAITVATLTARGGTSDGAVRILPDRRLWDLRYSPTSDGSFNISNIDNSAMLRSMRVMDLAAHVEHLPFANTVNAVRTHYGGIYESPSTRGDELSILVQEVEQNDYDSKPQQQAIRWIKETTQLPNYKIAAFLGVSRQALQSWSKGDRLTADHHERLFAVQELLQVASRKYSTSALMAAWLDTPYGLDGKTPADMIRASNFDRARYLAVSDINPSVRTPSWVSRGVPPAFLQYAERPQVAFPLIEGIGTRREEDDT